MDNKAKRMRDIGILPVPYLVISAEDYYQNIALVNHILNQLTNKG